MRILVSALVVCTFIAPAFAADIEHGYTVPTDLKMFERLRLTKAVGKAKGEGCDVALADAKADLARLMDDKADTVVAVWPLNGREGWKPMTTVDCEDNGKKQSVKLEALTIKQGDSAAYQSVTGERMLEIVEELLKGQTMMISWQLGAMRTLDYQGKLWYVSPPVTRKEYIVGNRNTRAVTAMREDLLSRMEYMANMLEAVPEFHGVELAVANKHADKKGVLQDEQFLFRVPTEQIKGFFAGNVSEQELLDSGAVLFTDGDKPPVKIDISLVAVEE